MKRILTLAVVLGLFYITMAGFSSAQQNKTDSKSDISAPAKQDQDDLNYTRDDLKTGLVRAFYDALMDAENDIENEETNGRNETNGRDEITGPDGKKRSVFNEARRTILEADRILARVKAENKKALVKLRNPPRRIYPVRKPAPKVEAVKDQQTIKKQIQAQEKLIEKQQQKLENLKKGLAAAPAAK